MAGRVRRQVCGLAPSSSEDEDCIPFCTRKPKRRRMLSSSSKESLKDASNCPICLCEVSSVSRGTPDGCSHVFCASCIVEWSRHVDACPIDRSRMSLIVIRDADGSERRHKVKPIRNREQEVEEVDPALFEDGEVCETCGAGDREDRLLICDRCGRLHHMECLVPALDTLPEGEWFCPICSRSAGSSNALNRRRTASTARTSATRPTSRSRSGTSSAAGASGSSRTVVNLNPSQRREAEQRRHGRPQRQTNGDEDFNLSDFIVDDEEEDEDLDESLWEDHSFLIDDEPSNRNAQTGNESGWQPHSFLLRTSTSQASNAGNLALGGDEDLIEHEAEEESDDGTTDNDETTRGGDTDESYSDNETALDDTRKDTNFVLETDESDSPHNQSFFDRFRLDEDEDDDVYRNPRPGTSTSTLNPPTATTSRSTSKKRTNKKSTGRKAGKKKSSSSRKKTTSKKKSSSTAKKKPTSKKKSGSTKRRKTTKKKKTKKGPKKTSRATNRHDTAFSADPSSSFSLFGSQDNLDFHGDTDLLEDTYSSVSTACLPTKRTATPSSSFSSPPPEFCKDLLRSQHKTLQRTPSDILKSPETVYRRSPLSTSSFYSMTPQLSRDAEDALGFRHRHREQTPKLMNGIEVVSAAVNEVNDCGNREPKTSTSKNWDNRDNSSKETTSSSSSSPMTQLQALSRQVFQPKSKSTTPSLLASSPSSDFGSHALRQFKECLKSYGLSSEQKRSVLRECAKELSSTAQDIEAIVKRNVSKYLKSNPVEVKVLDIVRSRCINQSESRRDGIVQDCLKRLSKDPKSSEIRDVVNSCVKNAELFHDEP